MLASLMTAQSGGNKRWRSVPEEPSRFSERALSLSLSFSFCPHRTQTSPTFPCWTRVSKTLHPVPLRTTWKCAICSDRLPGCEPGDRYRETLPHTGRALRPTVPPHRHSTSSSGGLSARKAPTVRAWVVGWARPEVTWMSPLFSTSPNRVQPQAGSGASRRKTFTFLNQVARPWRLAR